VDLSPEDLRKRLRDGKILPPERIPGALEGFYRIACLEQLRELTLREAAAQIDLRRREASGAEESPATEQVMVCLDGSRDNAALLRYGSRLAGRLNRNWYAVSVVGLEGPAPGAQREGQSENLTLANRLGATIFTLKANDVAEALAGFAREYRVGHVIVGKPRPRPWWKKWIGRESVFDRLLGRSRGFNLIVIDKPSGGEMTHEPKTQDKTRLCDFLTPPRIAIWDEPVSKDQALRALLKTLGPSCEGYLANLLEREAQGSTFLNEGVALPHARIEGLDRPLVALGLSHAGILDSYTENPIEVIFLLLSPKDENRSHLQLLAVAGRMMLNRTLRNRLRREKDPQAAFDALSEFESPG
jgi:two-component system sensor histidine kinase KdpD